AEQSAKRNCLIMSGIALPTSHPMPSRSMSGTYGARSVTVDLSRFAALAIALPHEWGTHQVKRFWTLSLRVRLMIIGLAGVSTALIMGGLAFFGALTYSVDRTLDNETLASAEEVGQMINDS